MNKIARHPFNDQLIGCIRQINFPNNKTRDQNIIINLCGLNDGLPKDLSHAGYDFNITKERTRQIKTTARATLSSMSQQYPNLVAALKYLHKRQPVKVDVATRHLQKKNIIGDDDNLYVILKSAEIFLGQNILQIKNNEVIS